MAHWILSEEKVHPNKLIIFKTTNGSDNMLCIVRNGYKNITLDGAIIVTWE